MSVTFAANLAQEERSLDSLRDPVRIAQIARFGMKAKNKNNGKAKASGLKPAATGAVIAACVVRGETFRTATGQFTGCARRRPVGAHALQTTQSDAAPGMRNCEAFDRPRAIDAGTPLRREKKMPSELRRGQARRGPILHDARMSRTVVLQTRTWSVSTLSHKQRPHLRG